MVDPPLKSWILSKPDVVAIEYHTSFPYAGDPFYLANVPEQDNRVFYNQVFAAPAIRMDGPHIPAANNPTAYEDLYQQLKASPSRAVIELDGSYDPGTRAGQVTARVIAEEALAGDQRLRIAITESDIEYAAPNGINIHEHVFRRFVPDTAGTVLVFSAPYPDTATVSLPFTLDASWTEANVDLVAFLQEQGSRQIEQGARVAAADLQVSVGDDPAPPAAITDQLAPVRPNPFNPQAEISFELVAPGRVQITVHDVMGRRVRTLVDEARPAGRHEVVWDGRNEAGGEMGSGLYVVKLAGPTGAATQKAILLR